MVKPLSALAVAAIKLPGKHNVGDGCYLQVSPTGTRSWLFRYECDGKGHWLGLGPCGLVTLAEAREKARTARRAMLDGLDPLTVKRQRVAAARLAAATAVTFKDAAERLIAAQAVGWSNGKHEAQWRSTLTAHAYPLLGGLPIASVNTDLVLKVLEPIWLTRPETASRVRGRIESVLAWAAARGLREGENPARWKGHLDQLLAPRSKVQAIRHHAALPWPDVPAFMATLRSRDGIPARALEFTVLTAARTAEVIGATWSEIDLDAALWTVPASRMKAGREHRVPLAPAAVALLAALPRVEDAGGLVFPGPHRGKPLGPLAMLRLMNGSGATVHGFRSAFRDWAAETTDFPTEVCEMALAHTVKSAVERAYRRGDLLDRRRQLMAAWAAFVGGAPAP